MQGEGLSERQRERKRRRSPAWKRMKRPALGKTQSGVVSGMRTGGLEKIEGRRTSKKERRRKKKPGAFTDGRVERKLTPSGRPRSVRWVGKEGKGKEEQQGKKGKKVYPPRPILRSTGPRTRRGFGLASPGYGSGRMGTRGAGGVAGGRTKDRTSSRGGRSLSGRVEGSRWRRSAWWM